MRFGLWSGIMALALAGLGVASCTQDFSQFEPTAGGGGAPVSCAANEKNCNGTCVPADDAAYGCGDSCTPCNTPNATPACTAGGSCTVGSCNAGFADCDSDPNNGCEAATGTDPANCGTCGTLCTAQNAAGACVDGNCALGACNAGFENCDNDPVSGCEAQIANDPANCGTCGTSCTAFETCKQGKCQPSPCTPGTADCNSSSVDGCETTLGTAENCAFCNNACSFANGSATCTNAKCELGTCDAGFDNCNGMPADGCEATLDTVTNCGACGNTCPAVPNAMPTCTSGMCGFTCNNGFADCDGMPGNGCEVDFTTDPTNCGVCGYVCSNANASGTACMAGACAPTCAPGFGDCAKPAMPASDDGCETDLASNVGSCGACGRACSGTNVASKSCTAGVCDSTCDVGFDNCSMPAMGADDGCEANVQTSNANCGSCGNTCSGGLDCDRGNLAQKFCGCSQNNECGNGGSCVAINGTCVCGALTCKPGETCAVGGGCSCNGNTGCGMGQTCCQSPAGCFDLTTDANNCGACGHQCPTGFICATPAGIPGCRCDADADCNGGTPGTCNAGNGACSCGGMQCAVGERCLVNGKCG